jgi:UDPglucose 6-dehydrogenase
MKVKIYGYGWVGKAMHTLFPDALIQDPAQGMETDEKADIAFVCVPTPNPHQNKLDTSIVEEVIKNSQEDTIIIRSTVNPGDCNRWEREHNKNICFMPEYLGESPEHPLLDKKQQRFLIIGGRNQVRRKAIELFQTVYNANVNIRQVSNLEAEIIKLSENRAIAYKVAQCQELYNACEAAGVDYYTIRDAVYGDDPRFNLWWTFVYPDKRGFSSKCIPKDIYAWRAWAQDSELTDAVLRYNERLLSGLHNNPE